MPLCWSAFDAEIFAIRHIAVKAVGCESVPSGIMKLSHSTVQAHRTRWDRLRQIHCMPFQVHRPGREPPGLFESLHCSRSVDRVSRYNVVSHTAGPTIIT
jgi:hypothetical protein